MVLERRRANQSSRSSFQTTKKNTFQPGCLIAEIVEQDTVQGNARIWKDMPQLSEAQSFPEHVQIAKESSWALRRSQRAPLRPRPVCWSHHHRGSYSK